MKESLIYLDNAATSFPKPKGVLEAVCHVMEDVGGNPGRSGHSMAIAAARVIYESRELVAKLFGVSDSSRIIFTSNATHSLNLAIKGLLQPGDHVITSSVEHISVTRPLSKLIKSGVEVSRFPCDREGSFQIDEFESLILFDCHHYLQSDIRSIGTPP